MNAILDIASIETSAAEVRREDVALSALLADLNSNYQGIGDKDEPLLVWDYSPTLPIMTTDAAKLKIILRTPEGCSAGSARAPSDRRGSSGFRSGVDPVADALVLSVRFFYQ
jgi:hypothetical protein